MFLLMYVPMHPSKRYSLIKRRFFQITASHVYIFTYSKFVIVIVLIITDYKKSSEKGGGVEKGEWGWREKEMGLYLDSCNKTQPKTQMATNEILETTCC